MLDHELFLQSLRKKAHDTSWFGNVGASPSIECMQVQSWEEAMQELSTDSFSDAQSEDVNIFRTTRCRAFRATTPDWIPLWTAWGTRWNAEVPRMGAIAEELTIRTISKYTEQHGLSNGVARLFSRCVRVSLLFQAFDGAMHNGLHQVGLQQFFEGHLLCGYRGEYPDGKYVVY